MVDTLQRVLMPGLRTTSEFAVHAQYLHDGAAKELLFIHTTQHGYRCTGEADLFALLASEYDGKRRKGGTIPRGGPRQKNQLRRHCRVWSPSPPPVSAAVSASPTRRHSS